eukprot:jgi/Bigna1/132540/aug1.18_g7248
MEGILAMVILSAKTNRLVTGCTLEQDSNTPATHPWKEMRSTGATVAEAGTIFRVYDPPLVHRSTPHYAFRNSAGNGRLFSIIVVRSTIRIDDILSQELSCAGTPNAQECIADRIVVVEVVNPNDSTRRFYTYRRKACITLTFFNNGIGRRLQRTTSQVMCGNPNLPIGLPVCCRTNGTRRREQGVQCLFANERVTYATNAQRCQELRQRTTSNPAACKDPSRVGGSDLSRSCARNGYQWIDNECRIKVQILSPSGKMGVVDELGATDTYGGIWRKDGANTFRVKWQNGEFPTASTTAEVPIGCETVATSAAQTLVCDITRVTREPVYRLPSDLPSYKEHIELHVAVPGSPPTDATHRVELERTDGLRVWVPSTLSEGSDWTTEVVIELPPFRTGGQRRFLLNMKSIVYVGDSSREYGFRNPPHFMPLFGK